MVFDAEFSEREGVLTRGYRLIAESMGRNHGRSGVVFVTPPGGVVSRLEDERARWLSERVVDDPASGRERESVVLFDPGVS
ncbi:hypothetical protein V6N13_009141 [Hibiscus sabdariffa]